LVPLKEAQVHAVEEEAVRKGRVVGVRMSMYDEDSDRPWIIPPSGRWKPPVIGGKLPNSIVVVQSNLLYIPKQELPSGLINRIVRLAAFQNPEFYRAQAMRLSTFSKPRVISCAEEFDKHIAIPRGCVEELKALLDDLNVQLILDDKRIDGMPLNVRFNGELLPEQQVAVADLLLYDTGVLSVPTAFGKTVIAARLIAEIGRNVLILVHRKQLLDQWRARLASFLNLAEGGIGQIGTGKKKTTGEIDVAMIQSLSRKGVVSDIVANYGHVIIDECHHISAFTFELVLKRIRAKYVMGLTATPTRKDGHHPIIFMQCGPIRYASSPRKAAQKRGFAHRVVLRETNTKVEIAEGNLTIHDVQQAILGDSQRTTAIGDDVRRVLREGRSPLILTERRAHLDKLAEELSGLNETLYVLHGGMREKKRREVTERFRNAAPDAGRVLLATGKYIGEGFDDSRLDTLFLTSPISWRGILQQYAGRLHRAHHAKREVVIYDYVDRQIPMAVRMFERRKKGYAALGYSLEDPLQPSPKLL
jgi:superfamily II DNA or RNA helicase